MAGGVRQPGPMDPVRPLGISPARSSNPSRFQQTSLYEFHMPPVLLHLPADRDAPENSCGDERREDDDNFISTLTSIFYSHRVADIHVDFHTLDSKTSQ
ncbi:hypothetical protein EYF80_035704 [Liparis tanakae]|uniref:Uncharacterized protein n=1 Tax=Liparis tanakae TaxID=230148 RepID=A0A4Z2GMQ7_9TELE|nr:hypothetical protein EYF80_035704 [Liparis tanakae]